jgi:hypothetical protein
MSLIKMLNDDKFNIFFSILVGIGLICIIKPACSGLDCSIDKPPISSDFDKYVYRLGIKCHEFTPEIMECPTKSEDTVEAFKECKLGIKNVQEGYETDNFARRTSLIKRCE